MTCPTSSLEQAPTTTVHGVWITHMQLASRLIEQRGGTWTEARIDRLMRKYTPAQLNALLEPAS